MYYPNVPNKRKRPLFSKFLTLCIILTCVMLGCLILYIFVKVSINRDTSPIFGAKRSLTLDSFGNIYVYSSDSPPIEKISNNGQFLAKWDIHSSTIQSSTTQFDESLGQAGIAVDTQNNVYVIIEINNQVQKFSSNGQFLAQWGTQGNDDGQFNEPTKIAIDKQNNIYIVDTGNSRIEKFDTSGRFLGKWGSKGSGNGQFNKPSGIAIDSQGNIYIGDSGNQRIEKLDSSGKFLASWRSFFDPQVYPVSGSNIAVDNDSNVYVVDGNGVTILNSQGNITKRLENLKPDFFEGVVEDDLPYVGGLALDGQRNVYVAKNFYLPFGYDQVDDYTGFNGYYNPHVEKFDSNGNFLAAYQPNPVNVNISFWVWLIAASPLLVAIAVWFFKNKTKNSSPPYRI